MADKGLYLAKGDRRAYVALDIAGNFYSLSKWSGVKTKDVKARLAKAGDIKPVSEIAEWLRTRKSQQVRDYIAQVKDKHAHEMQPLFAERGDMVAAQRHERDHLKRKQEERWLQETCIRQDRLNKGLRGLFDRLTGARGKMINRNEKEALACLHRDQEQRERLILAQTTERRELQTRGTALRERHKSESRHLAITVAAYLSKDGFGIRPRKTKTHEIRRTHDVGSNR